MNRRQRSLTSSVAFVLATLGLASCGQSENPEARAAFDACNTLSEEVSLLSLDGNKVVVALTGDRARSLATGDAAGELQRDGEITEESMAGLMIGLSMLTTLDCLAEATSYPGSTDQLRDGDRWEGWRYQEKPGAGIEITYVFEAVS